MRHSLQRKTRGLAPRFQVPRSTQCDLLLCRLDCDRQAEIQADSEKMKSKP